MTFGSAGLPMWAKLTAFLGFPIVACSAMAYAVWATAVWMGENAVKPVVSEHITTLRQMTSTQTQITTAVEKLATTQSQQAEALKDIKLILSSTLKMQERGEERELPKEGPGIEK